MGVYANGHLIYGFVHDDDTAELFQQLLDKKSDPEASFEELYQDEQAKHQVSLFSVGYADVDIISAFSISTSSKGMDIREIDGADLGKQEEYNRNIAAFFAEVGIETEHKPGWYILGYMD